MMGAAIFYCLVLVSTSYASPWLSFSGRPLATAAAFEGLMAGRLLSKGVLIIASISLFKTWNALALMAARLLMAQARVGLIPASFGHIDKRYRTPTVAAVFVSICTLAAAMAGKGAVLPIVNMASICLALSYVMACIELVLLRRSGPAEAP